jgi:hypothetical protein
MCESEFWIFKMPELQPYVAGSDPFTTAGVLVLRLAYPFSPATMCQPVHSPTIPQYVDLIASTDASITIARYEILSVSYDMESINRVAINAHPSHYPILIHSVEDNSPVFHDRFVSTFCDNDRLLHQRSFDLRSQVTAHLTTMASNSGVVSSHRSGTLWKAVLSVDDHSLCSMSGRLCTVYNNEIRIIDYLKPFTCDLDG